MRRVISKHYFDRSLNASHLPVHPVIASLSDRIFDCCCFIKDGWRNCVAMVFSLTDFNDVHHAGAAFCNAPKP